MANRSSTPILLSFVAIIIFGAAGRFIITPLYTDLLLKEVQREARDIAKVLSEKVVADGALKPVAEYQQQLNQFKFDLGLEKIKVFKTNGEVIFSTSQPDVGTVNQKDYFKKIVNEGITYSLRVEKGQKRAEGDVVYRSVIEVYVPIIQINETVAVFEIYFDTTAREGNYSQVAALSGLINGGGALIYLLVILWYIVFTSRKDDKGQPTKKPSSWSTFIVIIVWIMIVEAAIMILLTDLTTMPALMLVLLDSFLLGLFVTPIIFYLYIKPIEQSYDRMHKASEKVMAAEKITSIGLLSSGMAHEIKNPLSILVGNIKLMQKGIGDNDQPAVLESMLRAATRIDGIICQISSYYKQARNTSREMVSLEKAVLNSFNLYREKLEEKQISVLKDYEAGDYYVKGVESQLESLVQNLISNSMDAFAQVQDGREKRISVEIEVDTDDMVMLKYADNAVGMDEDAVSHLFEPFYSTKTPDLGVGIGMAICYNIVQTHRGTMKVSSEPGKGTVFVVKFPPYGAG